MNEQYCFEIYKLNIIVRFYSSITYFGSIDLYNRHKVTGNIFCHCTFPGNVLYYKLYCLMFSRANNEVL